MKQAGIDPRMIIGCVCFSWLAGGCMSVPSSPVSRFYMLQVVQEDRAQQECGTLSGVLIGIGPITVPEYQDRPHMVTASKENMLKFAQFDRWGESLGSGLTRVIRGSLSAAFARVKFVAYPWEASLQVKYQVVVEIVQLDSALDGDLRLVAQWQVVDASSMKTISISRFEFRQPVMPQDYSGLVRTLSEAGASLSGEIAQALAGLGTPPS